jgi:glycosyltransferase involved in cell wall biosynthesis
MNTADASMLSGNGKCPHETFNCIYHGTLTDIYGLDTAIKGFSKACRDFTDMVFHIFGTGPQLSELKCLTQQLNLQQFIVFHGEMPHDKMMEALGDMDLAILATRKDVFLNLSFSNKLAEYIYLKIPVISSDLDATKYYFPNEHILYFEAGNVADLSQKILFAYRNREKIQRMAESAYERAKAFDWAIMAQRYVQVVEGH